MAFSGARRANASGRPAGRSRPLYALSRSRARVANQGTAAAACVIVVTLGERAPTMNASRLGRTLRSTITRPGGER
jgi:hypothetical protein